MLDYVGAFGDSEVLASNARIKGWYSVGWSANGHASATNTWSKRPSARYCYFYTNGNGAPSRLIGLKRSGLFLTDILVAAWRYPCIIKHCELHAEDLMSGPAVGFAVCVALTFLTIGLTVWLMYRDPLCGLGRHK